MSIRFEMYFNRINTFTFMIGKRLSRDECDRGYAAFDAIRRVALSVLPIA